MENKQVIELIRRELPGILQRHPDVRDWVLRLTRDQYADKVETESRFDRLLEELRRDREENTRKWNEQSRRWEEQNQRLKEQNQKWEEQNQKWLEQNRRWEEQNQKWHEQSRRWEEQNQKWHEQSRRWEEQNQRLKEQNQRWEEQNRKWEANQKTINDILETLKAQAQKHESSIGALGARWGLLSEASFRNGLKAILEKSFGVEVRNVIEYDEKGEVFGQPDQVELDVVIHDNLLILCEIKSSISKSDMYTFEKKARFYENRYQQKASRKLVISPMVDDQAKKVARRLGIEVYSHANDVKPGKPSE